MTALLNFITILPPIRKTCAFYGVKIDNRRVTAIETIVLVIDPEDLPGLRGSIESLILAQDERWRRV